MENLERENSVREGCLELGGCGSLFVVIGFIGYLCKETMQENITPEQAAARLAVILGIIVVIAGSAEYYKWKEKN